MHIPDSGVRVSELDRLARPREDNMGAESMPIDFNLHRRCRNRGQVGMNLRRAALRKTTTLATPRFSEFSTSDSSGIAPGGILTGTRKFSSPQIDPLSSPNPPSLPGWC